jgi:hypothetical protein
MRHLSAGHADGSTRTWACDQWGRTVTELASAPSRHSSAGALERMIRRAGDRRREAEERCELCSVPVLADHRHMLDTERGDVMCVCQACSLLFSKGAASEGHYRLVPRRRVRLPAVSTKDLGVPVGLASSCRARTAR